MLPQNIKRVYMTKFTFREMRVQGTWLSGSKSRCSISRTERVLSVDVKKRKHPKIGAIFKKIWKVVLIVVNVILALATFIEFAPFVNNLSIW